MIAKRPAPKCTYIGPTATQSTCSKLCIEGASYCAEHYSIVYQKGTANRKRKKDIKRANAVWDFESEINSIVEELEGEGLTF